MTTEEQKGFEEFAHWIQPKMTEFERDVFQEFRKDIFKMIADEDRPFPDNLEQAMRFADEVLKPEFQNKVHILLKEWLDESLDAFNSLLLSREGLFSRMSFYTKAIKSYEDK